VQGHHDRIVGQWARKVPPTARVFMSIATVRAQKGNGTGANRCFSC
jgi:hypothetical protein